MTIQLQLTPEILKETHYQRYNYFREHQSASIKEAQSRVEYITGVKCSERQIAEFLKKMLFCCRKVGIILA